MDLSFLPLVNATLNGSATVLLIVGLILIKQRKINAHRNCMITAFALSCVFLVSYVTHYVWRAKVTGGVHTKYYGPSPWNYIYYVILITHILLAMTVPVFAVWLIRLGLKRRDEQHRRLAKIGYPVWLYVSITGVVIYLMLYPFNPKP